ncbi:MAG TPA: hypothetical protein VIJ51_07820 [Solirubrobacteraceae bacterium]
MVLHAFVVVLAQFVFAAVEDVAAEVVAAFLEVADSFDLAAVGLVDDVDEDVQRLEDPPVMRDRLAELRRPAARREHADGVVGADRAGVDRGDEAQDVGVVAADPVEVDPAARGGVQRPVVRSEVDPPELRVGQVGELGAVGEAEQLEQPERDVAVRAGVGDDHLGAPSAVLAVDQIDDVQRVPGGSRDDFAGQANGLV